MSVTDIPPEVYAPSFDKERDYMHRRMLSSVSHDLKTPLASIIGSLEIYERLNNILPKEKQLALVHVALQEGRRLNAFITNILDMARLENGMVTALQEPTEIYALLRNCIIGLSPRLEECTIDIKPSVAIEGVTDPVLLSRAVGLVLDNAFKYGGVPCKIQIECRQDEKGNAFICIGDNGRGVSSSQTQSIFSKYTRFANGDYQSAGTGLGLAICREIMMLLGGNITAENGANGGALFTLSFPLS